MQQFHFFPRETMRDGSSKKSKVSWTKTLLKKWLNRKTNSQDFEADDNGESLFSNLMNRTPIPEGSSTSRRSSEFDAPHTNYRIFVTTWNVTGKSPPNHLILDDWLPSSTPADVYVLGFQEIVPLNAGNVLGTEDNGPAKNGSLLSERL